VPAGHLIQAHPARGAGGARRSVLARFQVFKSPAPPPALPRLLSFFLAVEMGEAYFRCLVDPAQAWGLLLSSPSVAHRGGGLGPSSFGAAVGLIFVFTLASATADSCHGASLVQLCVSPMRPWPATVCIINFWKPPGFACLYSSNAWLFALLWRRMSFVCDACACP
jgi:hypothetical protein